MGGILLLPLSGHFTQSCRAFGGFSYRYDLCLLFCFRYLARVEGPEDGRLEDVHSCWSDNRLGLPGSSRRHRGITPSLFLDFLSEEWGPQEEGVPEGVGHYHFTSVFSPRCFALYPLSSFLHRDMDHKS